MDELIKRSEALKALGERPLSWTDSEAELAEGNQWDYDYAAIEAVPAVDAVSVVRCKDCEFYVSINDHVGNCTVWADSRNTMEYCSCGERKDGKEEV